MLRILNVQPEFLAGIKILIKNETKLDSAIRLWIFTSFLNLDFLCQHNLLIFIKYIETKNLLSFLFLATAKYFLN